MARQHCPHLADEVEEKGDIFKTAFTLFRSCHDIYDQKKLEEGDIELLSASIPYVILNITHKLHEFNIFNLHIPSCTGSNITAFMSFYRREFPSATVLPKMHFLEEHTIPWLKKWGVGFGLMGEQGAESIHRHINEMKPMFSHMKDPVKRLKCLLNGHLLKTSPINIAQRPEIKRRKKTSDNTTD